MSDIVIRFRDQYSVGPQIAAFGYRPAWSDQYVIGQLSRYVRRVDLKSGTVTATLSLAYEPIAAAVIPQVPGSIAVTPYNPAGPVFWLAITGSDGLIRVYNRTTLALVKTLAQAAGARGVLYAARAGIVFDGPNPGDLYYYNQDTDVALSRALVPSGEIVAALWVPTTTAPEIHYTFDSEGRGRVFTFDGTRWDWAGSFAGAGLTDITRVWTDGSQSWPYYPAPTQMQIASASPSGGGSVTTYSLIDPLNPVFTSTSRAQTPYQVNDIAGGAAAARTATEDPNGEFPLISEWKPMKTIIPADPGPDAIPLGITIHSDQGEWWLLGNNDYAPFFQYRTLTYANQRGIDGDTATYDVTPLFANQTTLPGVTSAKTYRMRVRGQTENVINVAGGTAIPGSSGYGWINPTSYASTHDRLRMVITHADTTTTTYLFNGTVSGATVFIFIDYTVDIPILPGDSVFIEYNTVDGVCKLAFQNQYLYLPADDDPGHPYNVFPPDQPLLGAAIQVDILSIR